jgi:hypothetical protein
MTTALDAPARGKRRRPGSRHDAGADRHGPRSRGREGRPWLAPLLLLIAAGLVYAIGLGVASANHDELHHILAARGLLASGEPRIAEGIYNRGYLYTWVVAQGFRLLGDSLVVARLPALLAAAALVPVMFLWLRAEAGPRAAWIATGLYALSPFAIELAQFARFYTLQTLAFLLGAIALHRALLGPAPPWLRLLLLPAAALALGLAITLQPTTMMGLVGLAAWAALAVALPRLLDPAISPRRRGAVLLAALAVLLALALVVWRAGILAEYWALYRGTPLFLERSSDEFWYYHARYSLYYPTLWPAVGVLGLAGLAVWPRPGLLALGVFATAFVLGSLGGSKALRYMAYAQPFLFVAWGLGLAALWGGLGRFLGGLRQGLAGLPAGLPRAWAGRLAGLLVGAAVACLAIANPAWLRSVALLAHVTVPGEEPNIDWGQAQPSLLPLAERAGIVVTTAELETLYYLGRYDLLLNRARFSELRPPEAQEFGRDWRTGRPVISTAASLAQIIDCYPSGLFVSPELAWKRPVQIDEPTKALVERIGQPVPLPPRSHLLAWTWEHPPTAGRPAGCAALDALGFGRDRRPG